MCERDRPPRPRLARHPLRRRRRARDPAAAGHRPRDRRPADLQRGRHGRGRPQRRDLQLPRAARASSRRAGTASPPHGDTEVIVHLYEEQGAGLRRAAATGCSPSRSGTRARRRLLLARDRVGKKPLFYCADGDGPLELRLGARGARSSDPDVPRELDPDALDCYLAYGYVPGAADDLPRACASCRRPRRWSVDASGARAGVERYWRLDYSRKRDGRPTASWRRSCARRIGAAVRRRMIADVPLGAFLSGGVDSSIVVSEMAAASTRAGQDVLDRLRGARLQRAAARAARSPSGSAPSITSSIVEPDAIELLPTLVRHYGEPYADSSAIPSFYLAELDPPARHGRPQRRRRRRELRRLPAPRGQRRHRDARPRRRWPAAARSSLAPAGLPRRPARARSPRARRLLLSSRATRTRVERYRRHVSVFTPPERAAPARPRIRRDASTPARAPR